jgi:hypothetical protein
MADGLPTLKVHRLSQEERSVFREVVVSVILSKKKKYIYICTCILFRKVSEIEQFYIIARIKERQDALTRVAKCIDVDGGIFEN